MDNTCHFLWSYIQYDQRTGSFSYCCKTPFLELTDSDLILGSELFNKHPSIVHARTEMLSGNRPSSCNYCWRLEDTGSKSFRQPADITNFYPEQTYLKTVDFYLGNTCDSKCVYCSSRYSSQWETENRVYDNIIPINVEPINKNNQLFWEWLDENFETVETINFLGGEPLIINDLYNCFDKIIKIINKKQPTIPKQIAIYSNLNTPQKYMDHFIEIVKTLSNDVKVLLRVSGEGTEKQFEYIRHGTSWKNWNKNLDRILNETNVSVTFVPTFNLLCLPSLPEYLKIWDNVNKEKVIRLPFVNQVPMSSPYSISNSPCEMAGFIERVLSTLHELKNVPEINKIAGINYFEKLYNTVNNNPSMMDSQYAKLFYKAISDNDYKRNLNFLSVFPELEQLFYYGKAKALE